MKIAITGASGFIGSYLARHFRDTGREVLALCRHPEGARDDRSGIAYLRYDLRGPIEEKAFEAVYAVVHCAYVRYSRQSPDADEINIQGTRRLLDLCRKKRIKMVFLSTFSAHEQAESHYGRHKFILEGQFDPTRDLVIRPGLVLGAGGMLQQICRASRRSWFLPVIDGGRQPVQTLAIDDLACMLGSLLEKNRTGRYSLAEQEPVPMSEFILRVAARLGRRPILVPIPAMMTWPIFAILERLRNGRGPSYENVLGLKCLRAYDVRPDVEATGVKPKSFQETLSSLDLEAIASA